MEKIYKNNNMTVYFFITSYYGNIRIFSYTFFLNYQLSKHAGSNIEVDLFHDYNFLKLKRRILNNINESIDDIKEEIKNKCLSDVEVYLSDFYHFIYKKYYGY